MSPGAANPGVSNTACTRPGCTSPTVSSRKPTAPASRCPSDAPLGCQRTAAAGSADQRRRVPGARPERSRPKLHQRHLLAAAEPCVCSSDATSCEGPRRIRGGVPHQRRDVASGRWPDADLDRGARNAVVARLDRATAAARGDPQPLLPPADTRRRTACRYWARQGGAPSVVGPDGSSVLCFAKLIYAFLLGVVLAVMAVLEGLARTRLVGRLDASERVLVGRIREAPRDPRAGPERRHAGDRDR